MKFIRNHKRVYKLFLEIIDGGLTVVLFPDTRFAYADMMLHRFYINRLAFLTLIDHPEWSVITQNISDAQVDAFEETVKNFNLFAKIKLLRSLSSVLSSIIHHSEATYFQASWTLPLYFSLGYFLEDWCITAAATFDDISIAALKNIYVLRYTGGTGRGSKIGVYHHALVMAWCLDPNTQPKPDIFCRGLPFGLKIDIEAVINAELGRFFKGTQLDRAGLQFKKLLLTKAPGYGDDWSNARLRYETASEAFWSNNSSSSYNASRPSPEALILLQANVYNTLNARVDWQLTGVATYPDVAEFVLRYLCMTTQSANVERVNKANKFIHTKSRSSLKNDTVNMLLYCYVSICASLRRTSSGNSTVRWRSALVLATTMRK